MISLEIMIIILYLSNLVGISATSAVTVYKTLVLFMSTPPPLLCCHKCHFLHCVPFKIDLRLIVLGICLLIKKKAKKGVTNKYNNAGFDFYLCNGFTGEFCVLVGLESPSSIFSFYPEGLLDEHIKV